MIISVKFRFIEDIKRVLVFHGDPDKVRAIQGVLHQGGMLIQRSNCIVIKHPVTGLECALSPGDEVQFDAVASKFIVIQHDTTALPWCRIEFDYAMPTSGTLIAGHVLRCSKNSGENVRLTTLCAGVPTIVKLRLGGFDNPDGEVLYTGDVPMPKTAVERQCLETAFSYRGHDIRVWSEGVQFVILHSGLEQEMLEKDITVEIYIK